MGTVRLPEGWKSGTRRVHDRVSLSEFCDLYLTENIHRMGDVNHEHGTYLSSGLSCDCTARERRVSLGEKLMFGPDIQRTMCRAGMKSV
jgi:hypothetical protein